MNPFENFEHIKITFLTNENKEIEDYKTTNNTYFIPIISIDRPDKLNAINLTTIKEIYLGLKFFELNDAVKCLIIRGAKKFTKKPSFSTGADLSSPFEKKIKPNIPFHMVYSINQLYRYFNLIETYPKPLIAAVDGFALGGGLELVLVCDIIIASKRSSLGFSEIFRGIFPAGGGTQRMTRSLGLNRSIKMLYFGKRYSAKELYDLGFIQFLVENEHFEKFLIEKSKELAQKRLIALQTIKKCLKIGNQVSTKIGKYIEQFCFELLTKDSEFPYELDNRLEDKL